MNRQSHSWIVLFSFLIIYSFSTHFTLQAQSSYLGYANISIDQGLSHRSVNDIIQDKNGFLWFATDNGLNKYDGYKFTVYKHDLYDPFSLSHNRVNKICDSEIYGRQVIWIGTEGGGLNAFDVKWERFINWKKEKTDTSWDAENNAHCCVFYDSAASEFKMYYSSFTGSDSYWAIGLATAKVKDPIADLEWIKYDGNPILSGGERDNWDSKGAATPSVIKHDGIYQMWYTGMSHEMIASIGYATSKDGINWKKYENNPVNREDIQPLWEKSNTSVFPTVLFDGHIYHMWYGILDDIWEEGKIGYATSKDGMNWEKDKNNPVVNTFPKGHWGDKIVGGPSVFYEDGLYYMTYGAKSFMPYKNSCWAIALSEDGSIWKQYEKPALEIDIGYETQYWSAWIVPFNNKYHLWYTEGGVDYASKSTSNFLNIRYAYSTDLKNWERKRDNKIWKEDHTCLTSNFVRALHYDRSGSIWIGLWGEKAGLNRIRIPEKDKWFKLFFTSNNTHSLEIDHYLNSNSVYDISEDNNGNLWVAASTFGVFKFDPLTNQFDNYTIISKTPNYLPSFSINTVYSDNTNTVWCGLENGEILKINNLGDSGEERKTKYTIQNLSEIKKIYGLDSENLILCLQNGRVDIFNKESGNLVYSEHVLIKNELLLKHGISSIFEDNTNITWIGTDNGIIKIDPSKKLFNTHNILKKDRFASDNMTVTSVLEPRDENSNFLWIGTEGNGIIKYNQNDGIFRQYLFNRINDNNYHENTVNTLYEDKKGIIWIGTPQTLNKFDPATESNLIYRKKAHDLYSISGSGINSILEDKAGKLWIGSTNGLQWHDKNRNNFPYVMADQVNTIYEFEYGGKRVLLIGMYENGMRELDLTTFKFKEYRNSSRHNTSISNNNVNVITEINYKGSRSLMIGTDDGLNIINIDDFCKKEWGTYNVTHFHESDGMSGNIINGILEAEQGIIWLSTNRGLSKFDPKEERFWNYDRSEGLSGNEFLPRSFLRSRTGEFYFGGFNGLISFFPDSIKDNKNIPNIVITDLQVFNRDIDVVPNPDSKSNNFSIPKHISLMDTLTLTHKETVFSLEFAALDFHNPEHNKYKYLMEGFESEWNYTDYFGRRVTYTNLDPGEYVFRVIGSNNDNYWNYEGKSLVIIIKPPWWKTTWAYIVYILSALMLIYSFIQFQLSRIRLKHEVDFEHLEVEKYREIDALKSRFFANISHEFRTPLTLILGPVEKLLEKTDNFESAKNLKIVRRNAKRLLNLINQLLDLSRIEEEKMSLRAVELNIVPFIKVLVMSFQPLAEMKEIKINFSSGEPKIFVYFDKEIMSKILHNLISNAFKFTDSGGNINVDVRRIANSQLTTTNNKFKEGCVEIVLKDTGIGISDDEIERIFDRFYQVDGSHKRDKEGTGIGLSLTKEFVELQRGEIHVSSKTGEGTSFTLRFPLGNSHLSKDEIIEKDIKDFNLEHYVEEKEQISKNIYENEPDDLDITLKSNKPILLIVEDNEDVRTYIKEYLYSDYNLVEAENGIKGFTKAIEIIPDLILSDIMMPKMDGIELCSKLKNDERTSHIPVILLTAKASDSDKIEGLQTGADDYIMKPFNIKELEVRIKNLNDQRRKLREYFKNQGIFEIEDKSITSTDKKFLIKAQEVISGHLSDIHFNIDAFAAQMALSRSQLYRKFIALYDESPSDFIRRIRLSKAAKLIEQNFGNISEIAYEVGFSNPSHFTKNFKEHFKITPRDYENNILKNTPSPISTKK